MNDTADIQSSKNTRFVPLPVVILIVAGIIGVVAFIRICVVQPVSILELSMRPTLLSGDRALAVTNLVTRRRYKRGDIVRLKDPKGDGKDLIKRLIALPGDTFEARDGAVFVNGERLYESYTAEPVRYSIPPFILPADHVMVLGDNRNESDDCSSWGPIPMSLIKGRVVYVLYPSERVGRL